MPELHDPTREALGATVRAVVERHGGPGKVAGVVGVHRTQIHRWMNGAVSLHNLGLLADKLGEPIVVTFGATKEAPPAEADGAFTRFVERWESDEPPAWAAGLTNQIIEQMEKMITGDGDSDRQSLVALVADRLVGRLEARRMRGDEGQRSTLEEDPAGDSPRQQEPLR